MSGIFENLGIDRDHHYYIADSDHLPAGNEYPSMNMRLSRLERKIQNVHERQMQSLEKVFVMKIPLRLIPPYDARKNMIMISFIKTCGRNV